MRILVTGGAGFIGSAMVRALISKGAGPVLNVDKLTYAGDPESVGTARHATGYQLLEADIANAEAMRKVFLDFRPEAVIHLAAETHVDRSIEGPGAFIQTNVVGTSVLLACALNRWRSLDSAGREGFRFLHVSTDEVYGALGSEGHFTEESAYRPNSPYAASKAGADHLVRAFYRTYGLPILVTNCGNNYGPYQFPEKLLPLMIQQALRGEALPVYGKGEQVRDWIHVDDHVAALLCVLEHGHPGETYVIGARREMRNIDLVIQLCEILDAQVPSSPHCPHGELISFVEDRPGHDQRYAIDPTKIETVLGWQPQISFERGLNDTVAWYLENRAWCERTRKSYNQQRLGL